MKKDFDFMNECKALKSALRKKLMQIPDKEDRLAVLEGIDNTASLLIGMQGQKQIVRLEIWACVFMVIDFMRRCGSLGREKGKLDEFVKVFLNNLILDLMQSLVYRYREES